MSVMSVEPELQEQDMSPPDPDKLYEFVGGEWREKGMGGESSWISSRIVGRLDLYVEEHNLGYLFVADAEYCCFPEDKQKFRRPDLSFVRRGRFPGEKLPAGRIELAPDLMVEVVSPTDKYVDIEARLEDFRRVGVPLMWVVNPANRTVKIYRNGNPVPEILTDEGVLDGGEVLPGWNSAVKTLFPPLAPPQA